jgi:ankyrin repeat protein
VAESIRSFDTSLTALAPFLGKALQTDQNDSRMPIIDSLLPSSAFLEEACAQGLAIKRLEKFGPVEFLNLATFMISNNFPGETNGEQVYKWLKRHGSTDVLKAIATTKGPTGEALLENLFRLAIEAEDIPISKRLIEAGVDPNGHICRHPRIPDHMNPLQYACIRGNSELALELINAGSSIDQPGTGWKSSALVLAIIGEYLRDHRDFWEYGKEETQAGDDQDLEIPSACFFNLIYSLVDKGAAINPIIDQSSPTLQYWDRDKTSNLDIRLDSVMKDGHSPLTAASKYRNDELVNFFLQQGADQDFLTQRDTCALRECLFSWEQTELDGIGGDVSTLYERVSIFPGSESLSKVIGVARSLIGAGVDVDKHFLWCPQEEDDEEDEHFHHFHTEEGCYLSTLDLSVLTESVELVDMMLCAGATTSTRYSLEQAIKTGSLEMVNALLSAGAPLSSSAVKNAIRQDEFGGSQYIKTLLRQRPGFITQMKLLCEAIRRGNESVLKHIFDYGDFKGGELVRALEGLEGALEGCCGSGYIGTLRLIIDECSKYNVSITSHLGGSLGRAILRNHDDIADTLLLAGADINAVYSGRTALMTAIGRKHRKMVLKLIDANSILNTKTEDDGIGIGSSCVNYHEIAGDPLIMAIEWGDDFVVEKLLDAGASMDALGHTYRLLEPCRCITPLTAAIMSGNLILVNTLLSRGAAINPPGFASRSMTPLAAAIRSHNSDLVEILISKGANPYDRHALREATGNSRLLYILLTALQSWSEPPVNEEVGDEALASAMEKKDREIVRTLLDSSLMRINPIRRLSQALLSALEHDSTPNLEIIRMVLDHGAGPNTVWELCIGNNNNIFLRSALCTAIKRNNLEQLKILLDAGGKPDSNLTCGMYDSPMQFAASCKRVDMVRILLEAGSDPNVVAVPKVNVRNWNDFPERNNGTPLQIAVSNQDIETIRLLQQYNGNPNGIFGNMPHTPLQMASRDGSKEIVELLLEHGAEVNAPPAKEFGATALQFAAIKGLLGIAHLLLEYGADVNAPPAEVGGRTALEGAAEHGRIDMVQLLLNAGANIFQEGEEAQYESAIKRASQNGHHAVRRLLESYHG